MKRASIPVVAGVLMIIASAPYFWVSARWFINPDFIPHQMGGGKVWPWTGVIIMVPFWSPLIAGAICALFRRACGLAFTGAMSPLLLTLFLRPWGWGDVSLGQLLNSFPFGIYIAATVLMNSLFGAAAILLWLYRQEFTDRQLSSQHLYAPPDSVRQMLSKRGFMKE